MVYLPLIFVSTRWGKVHSVVATAANVADIDKAAELIREDDEVACGNNGYQGLGKRLQEDEEKAGTGCRINEKKGAGRKREKEICAGPMNHLEYLGEPQWDRITEGLKSKVRSKAEHMFGIMKGIFRFRKARYRGLKKNLAKLQMIFASANLLKYGWAGCPEWKTAV
jgi:IS5 family transposase